MLRQSLTTKRLFLRRHRRSDAKPIACLLDDWDVARWLSTVPHPYTRRDAVNWIAQCGRSWQLGRDYQFVVVQPPAFLKPETVVGHMGLSIKSDPTIGELGYWFGQQYWGRGYGKEAAAAVVDFGFTALRLDTIEATALPNNRRSQAVLASAGLRECGRRTVTFHSEQDPVECPLYRVHRASR